MAQQDETQIQLDELDTRLERLRALYEQYFCGIERIEPHVQRKDVERRVQTMRKIQLRNTAARFRFQALVQKYTTYQTYWQRVTRQIEEGTYRRDLVRQQRYGAVKANPDEDAPVLEIAADDVEAFESLEDLDEVFDKPVRSETAPAAAPPATPPRAERVVEELPLPFSESLPPPAPAAAATPSIVATPAPVAPSKPAAAPAPVRRAGLSVFGAAPGVKAAAGAPKPGVPAPAKPMAPATVARPSTTAPAAASPPGPVSIAKATVAAPGNGEEPHMRELYERYRQSRKQTGEGEVSFDAVARQVRDTLPKLAEKFPGADVSLDVTVKDGRTVLRPVVRKK